MTELEVSSAGSWNEVDATSQQEVGWRVGVEGAGYRCLEPS